MAGIGFRLQRLLYHDSYSDVVRAYAFSAIVSSGPWLLSILGLGAIAMIHPLVESRAALQLFQCIVIYVLCGSLIGTGFLQMAATRAIADRMYARDIAALPRMFERIGAVTTAVGAAAAAMFAAYSGLMPLAVAAVGVLAGAVCLTWTGLLFLSAAKDYLAVVRAFAIGYAISVLGSIGGGASLDTMLWGFAAGQVALATMIAIRIHVEFASSRPVDAPVRIGIGRSTSLLIAIGAVYQFGVWIDKIVFWCGPDSLCLQGSFRIAPRYDSAFFIGYLSIVPALALFLIQVEVIFYRHYAAFFAAVRRGDPLPAIQRRKHDMVHSLRLSALRLLQIQGVITFTLVWGAPLIIGEIGLPTDEVPLVRLALIAALFHVLLQIAVVMLLYFDWQKQALVVVGVFAIVNLLGSESTVLLGRQFHGLGYLSACAIGFTVAMAYFERGMGSLEYETFCSQPMRP